MTNDGFGGIPAHFGIGNFAHPAVKLQLFRRLIGMVVLHQQAGGFRAVAEVEFRAKVSPKWHKVMKSKVVADNPGRDAGEEKQAGEGGADEAPGNRSSVICQQQPDAARRQKDDEGWVAEGDEPPEDAEGGP